MDFGSVLTDLFLVAQLIDLSLIFLRIRDPTISSLVIPSISQSAPGSFYLQLGQPFALFSRWFVFFRYGFAG